MLTELETLSQNIGRLIAINQRHQEARHALEAQLEQSRAECEAAPRQPCADTRGTQRIASGTRCAVRENRQNAQVRLNAILEKLPRGQGHSGTDSQLDLLDPAHPEADTAVAVTRHGENA